MKISIISNLATTFATVVVSLSLVGLGTANASTASPSLSGDIPNSATLRPSSVPSGYNLVKNYHSGLCLHVAYGSQSSGIHIDQQKCNANDHAQAWSFPYIGGLGYQIRNYHSGLCLAINGNSNDAGAIIVQVHCSTNHAWLWVLYGGDVGALYRNYHTGKCLVVNHASQQAGAFIVQEPCHRSYHEQEWNLTR
jgi:hypothetical protein